MKELFVANDNVLLVANLSTTDLKQLQPSSSYGNQFVEVAAPGSLELIDTAKLSLIAPELKALNATSFSAPRVSTLLAYSIGKEDPRTGAKIKQDFLMALPSQAQLKEKIKHGRYLALKNQRYPSKYNRVLSPVQEKLF